MNIWLLLGLKTDNFRSGLKRAVDDTKEFESSWKGMRKVFAAGGITTLALGFLKSFANDAQTARAELEKMGQPIPGHVQSLAVLGDAFDAVTRGASWFVGTVLNGYRLMGEEAASVINRMRGISEAEENIRMAAARGAEEQEARLAKAREANSPEKVAAALAKLEETRRQSAISRASGEEKLNLLLAEHVRLTQEAAGYGERSIEGAKIREQIERNLVQIAQVGTQVEKERADAAAQAKKDGEDYTKRMHAAEKERVSEQNRLNKARFESLTTEQQVEALARSEASLRGEIIARKREGKDTTSQEADLQQVLNDLTEKRKALLEETNVVQERQRKIMEGQAEAARMTQRAYESILFSMTNGGYDSRQIGDANDQTLREILRRNNESLVTERAKEGMQGFPFMRSFQVLRLENENRRIEAELNLRSGLRRDVGFLGVDRARAAFKGDPIVFDRLVQQFVTGLEKSDETNRILTRIEERMRGAPAEQALASLQSWVRQGAPTTVLNARQIGGG